MSFLAGRCSLSRFRLIGGPKRLNISELSKGFRKHQVGPLHLEYGRELNFGWARPIGFEGSKTGHWDLSDCQFDDSLTLRIRIERRKIPTSLLHLLLSQRIDDEEGEKGRQLSNDEKSVIKETLEQELLMQTLPDIKTLDIIWNLNKKEMLVLGTAKRDLDIFELLFQKTFGKPLNYSIVKVTPPMIGLSETELSNPEKGKSIQRLLDATPSIFFAVPN